MYTRTDFPYQVREIEQLLIPLSDGTRLAARVWLPVGSENVPVPVILEYLPYRKRDGTAIRDALTHPWFAGHGYACIRVDMRGNGESEGLMQDEYAPQEQADALEIIDWLCQQDWCDGNVGMMGISWGGFNGLQVAALKPQALKAIITLCSTDDRYQDDIHYKGGNMLLENVGWAGTMLNFSAAVPDPMLAPDWRERWLQRLENMPLMLENWLSHQRRDSYWKHGSVCEDYSAIEAAVYAIGGWGDAYSTPIHRMMENLQCPRKALIGPWAHKYPHFALPDPAIGFLQEALRWWNYWLKGIDNGIMDEPRCTFYMQDAVAPQATYPERPGQWLRTDSWPAPEVQPLRLYLVEQQMRATQGSDSEPRLIRSPLTTGRNGGEFCVIWLGPEFPTDQRIDDANSLCFDSVPMPADTPLLGGTHIRLTLSSDQPCGQICVRLNDVAPDGSATRITYGCLNLKTRNSREHPEPLEPGKQYEIDLVLDEVGYQVPEGHHLRIAISSAYFPLIWPTETFATLTLHGDDNWVDLPFYTGDYIDNPFQAPESAAPEPLEYITPSRNVRQIHEDVSSGEVSTYIEDDFGHIHFLNHGLKVHQVGQEVYSVKPYDAHSAKAEVRWKYQVGRDGWNVSVNSQLKLHCDGNSFIIEAYQTAEENGQQVHERHWHKTLPREVF